MEEIEPPPASTNPRKRPAPTEEDSPEKKPLNLKGTQFVMPTPPDTDQSSNASPTCNYDESAVRESSPAPSTALSSIDTSVTNPLQDLNPVGTLTSTTPTASASGPPPKKRRKLTLAEKEQQQREKEVKAAEKVAEKARKEAEKARKDVEKAEDRARKDEDKRVKDEEKRKKAEEKEARLREKELKEEAETQKRLKKERQQMRLGAFFQKPATPVREPGDEETYVSARRKSLSLEPFDAVADQIRRSESPCINNVQPTPAKTTPVKPPLPDYHKYFLPFQLKTYTRMAHVRAVSDPDAAQDAFDFQLEDPFVREKYDLGLVDSYAGLDRQFALERRGARGLRISSSMRQLVDQIQGSIEQPIDLTSDERPQDPIDMLQIVPRRHIAFEHDVRPAYFGTYTKIRSSRTARRLSRNPFSRCRPDTDYDYDSEAEWEEPEEGEDLLDEEDEEAESVGDAHEMDEFLDDEEDALKNKRKLITGDLVPTNTGLCWEDESNRIVPSVEDGHSLKVMQGMTMGILLPGFSGQTIDPFSTSYWQSESLAVPTASGLKSEQAIPSDELMPPPRPPLQARPNSNGTLDHLFSVGTEGSGVASTGAASTQTTNRGRKAAPKTLSKEDMEEFKGFVVGSQANKADLLKELKTRFPKLTNETIKATLYDNFAQVGATKAEKKWGYVSTS